MENSAWRRSYGADHVVEKDTRQIPGRVAATDLETVSTEKFSRNIQHTARPGGRGSVYLAGFVKTSHRSLLAGAPERWWNIDILCSMC